MAWALPVLGRRNSLHPLVNIVSLNLKTFSVWSSSIFFPLFSSLLTASVCSVYSSVLERDPGQVVPFIVSHSRDTIIAENVNQQQEPTQATQRTPKLCGLEYVITNFLYHKGSWGGGGASRWCVHVWRLDRSNSFRLLPLSSVSLHGSALRPCPCPSARAWV
ncbi:hypothetical protein LX32DRAFT_35076 [Colletotrichum zoysiae]|uniref:Uncharacterized protein n=1 Tax=Colletotrichum zoysiae TaxID=1216348 RepID=A0AAD9HDU1_9PEZI|nr:hypothetical protein LX32DRAFT_35076 [Colletotrichum zoysiae]